MKIKPVEFIIHLQGQPKVLCYIAVSRKTSFQEDFKDVASFKHSETYNYLRSALKYSFRKK